MPWTPLSGSSLKDMRNISIQVSPPLPCTAYSLIRALFPVSQWLWAPKYRDNDRVKRSFNLCDRRARWAFKLHWLHQISCSSAVTFDRFWLTHTSGAAQRTGHSPGQRNHFKFIQLARHSTRCTREFSCGSQSVTPLDPQYSMVSYFRDRWLKAFLGPA